MNYSIRKILTLLLLVQFSCVAFAITPEKVWQKVTLADGSQVSVMMIGNEWAHCYVTQDGRAVDERDDGSFVFVDKDSIMDVIRNRTWERRCGFLATQSQKRTRASQGLTSSDRSTDISANYECFRGKKRGIVILAEFSDKTFLANDSDPNGYYTSMLNQEGFADNSNKGSVHDYFSDMSYGLFDLSFDVYGPVTVSKSSTYYGGKDGTALVGEFMTEAIKLADEAYDIDWSQYDWNGDGNVEEVFVLYAGFGRATGGLRGNIWPHMATLTYMKQMGNDIEGPLTLDGLTVDVYACSNELYGNTGSQRMGIGPFCHEFSHCMGLPDMYDINYSDNRGMASWDLMNSGNYNGYHGSCPAPWTPWERHFAGWLEYTVLQENDSVKGLQPLLDEAKAYVIYNDGNPNEYYTLHNVGNSKWDTSLPDKGLLITHVDYDETLFKCNIVNSTGKMKLSNGTVIYNDHERMIPVSRRFGWTYYDTYPINYGTICIDSLTDYSEPAQSLWNTNTDGSLLMHKPLYNISCDETTGYVSFNFMPKATSTAVCSIQEDSGTTTLYDLTGKVVGTDEKNLAPGVYIRSCGGRTEKILIR